MAVETREEKTIEIQLQSVIVWSGREIHGGLAENESRDLKFPPKLGPWNRGALSELESKHKGEDDAFKFQIPVAGLSINKSGHKKQKERNSSWHFMSIFLLFSLSNSFLDFSFLPSFQLIFSPP